LEEYLLVLPRVGWGSREKPSDQVEKVRDTLEVEVIGVGSYC
jgi:hypothetical protein